MNESTKILTFEGEVHFVSKEVFELANRMKNEVEKKLEQNFITWDPTIYSYKLNSGRIYNVKVKVGYEEFVHITFHKPENEKKPMVLFMAEIGKTVDDLLP